MRSEFKDKKRDLYFAMDGEDGSLRSKTYQNLSTASKMAERLHEKGFSVVKKGALKELFKGASGEPVAVFDPNDHKKKHEVAEIVLNECADIAIEDYYFRVHHENIFDQTKELSMIDNDDRVERTLDLLADM